MADKSFGVKDINLIGASGTPEIESPNNLNINAVNVAISTDMSIGGALTVTGDLTVNGTTTTIDTAVTSVDSLSVDGAIISQGDAAGGANDGSRIDGQSGFSASFNNSSSLIYRGYTTGSSSPTFSVTAAGSASFGGDVYVNANLLVKGGNGSGVFIRNQGDTAYTIDLNENGSAALVGPINLGAWANNANAAIYMVNQSNTGSIILKGNGSSDIAFGVYKNGWSGSNAVARINANGGAEFNATVDVTSANYSYIGRRSSDNTAVFAVDDTGFVNVGPISGSNSNIVLNGSNGSATFAGTIISGGNAGGGAADGSRIDGGSGFSASFNNTTSLIYRGYTTGSSSPSFSIQASGNAYFAGNVSAANVSDIRFKENITDANPQLADVVDLGSQLKNWDWKDNAPLNEELRAKRFLGLVAQEAEKVCPGLTYTVSRTKQGAELTPETTDAEGNVTPATYEELDDSCKAINHDILVMKLLGAVAEQNTQIETLKTQNATLEARLTALEG